MINYLIEGNVDFFKELQTIQQTLETTVISENEINISNQNNNDNNCLLTGEILLPDAVTLQCGHKFNYKPLFKEVILQKCTILPKNISSLMTASYVQVSGQKYNEIVSTPQYNSSLNLETTKLNYNEVKCPYCRSITPYLLPYYPYPEIKQIRYVNTPSNLCMPGVKCSYYTSKSFEKECSNMPTYDEDHGLLCKTHLKVVINAKNETNNKKNKKGVNTKIKSSASVMNKSIDNDNIIVSVSEISDQELTNDDNVCSYILTSGTRKGAQCGAKSYIVQNNNTINDKDVVSLCKRHYNIVHKK